jgi:hypothetical protein
MVLASLVGCSNTRTGSNDSIFAMPSDPTVAAVVGGSRTLRISFNSSDGNSLSQLSVTGDLGALPAGWTAQVTFHCPTVGTGNGCVLNLTYAPLGTGSGTLRLTYSYVNNAGAPLKGSVAIPYSATPDNNIVAIASPSGQVVVVSNSTQAVVSATPRSHRLHHIGLSGPQIIEFSGYFLAAEAGEGL